MRLLGAVAYDRVPGLIAESHVVCQPSLVEPFGQALLEGMACIDDSSTRTGYALPERG